MKMLTINSINHSSFTYLTALVAKKLLVSSGLLQVIVMITILASVLDLRATSEFFYQADEGELVVTPLFRIGQFKLDLDNTSTSPPSSSSTTTTEYKYQLASEYGFTTTWSVGFHLNYRESVSKTKDAPSEDFEAAGLNDFKFYLKSFYAFEFIKIFYGAQFSISPKFSEYGVDGLSGNNYSGADRLAPYLGVEFHGSRESLLGAKIQSEILLGKGNETQGSQSTTFTGSESTQFDLFYESTLNDVAFGSSLNLIFTKDTLYPLNLKSNSVDHLFWNLYFPISYSGQVTLLPQITYFTFLEREFDFAKVTFASGVFGRLAARFVF